MAVVLFVGVGGSRWYDGVMWMDNSCMLVPPRLGVNRQALVKACGKSAIYRLNKIGASTQPCLRPLVVSKGCVTCDWSSLTLTQVLEYKAIIPFSSPDGTPQCNSFDHRMDLSTLSKAAE